jgi:uncharacterized protein (TIGR02145 family)
MLQLSKIVRAENALTTNQWLLFSAFPGGNRNTNGNFNNLGNNGNWWSSSENSSTNAWNRNMNYNNGNVNRNNNNKGNGFSVRCLRDLLNNCYKPACCWAGFLNF